MKTIEELALEAAKELVPARMFVGDFIQKFAVQLIAAVDAERGKDAVAIYKYQPATLSYGVQWLINTPLPNDTPLFLSPTLPEGTVLIRAEPTTEILDYFIGATNARGRFEAMIQAAQEGVTK